jgi:hypothetical protein
MPVEIHNLYFQMNVKLQINNICVSSLSLAKQHFLSKSLLRIFYLITSGFHFFEFRENIILHNRSSALRRTPTVVDKVPVFMFRSDKVAQLYSKAPGSLFIAFYDSQGYGGDILTHLHTGKY